MHPDTRLDRALQSERFDLHPLDADNAQPFADLAADPEVVKALVGDWSTARKRLENALDWIAEERNQVIWGVHDRNGVVDKRGAFVGIFGVELPLPEVGQGPQIFYAYRREAWGRGVASEVAASVIDALFAVPAVAAIEALVLPNVNPASVRVLEKQGMELVGRYPLAKYLGDESLPTIRYEIWRAQVAVPAEARSCIREAAFKIGQFVSDGICSYEDMAAALMVSAHENGLVDLIGIDEVGKLISGSLEAGASDPGWLHYRLRRGARRAE